MSKPYHHGDLRRALIEAALELVVESGYEALSLRAVAQRAGVSHAAPYRHFEGKAELWAAVAEESFRGLLASMRAAVEGVDDPTERHIQLGQGYVDYGLEHPHQYRVMFGPTPPEDSEAARACFQMLVESIQYGQKRRAFRPGDSMEMALGAWALVHGLTLLALDGRLQDGRQLFRRLGRLQLEGYHAQEDPSRGYKGDTLPD